MLRKGSMLALFAMVALVAGEAVLFDEATFKSEIGSGKNYFVKFFAPWCGHCKRLKPDWDKLADAFEDSKATVIADVDCTVESDLCQEFGVTGYPTLKYFNDETGSEGGAYQGGRSYEDLEEFVNENLSLKCSVADTEGCNDRELSFITSMKEKGDDIMKEQMKRLQNMQGKAMKPSLSAWLNTRLRLLGELVGSDEKTEL